MEEKQNDTQTCHLSTCLNIKIPFKYEQQEALKMLTSKNTDFKRPGKQMFCTFFPESL